MESKLGENEIPEVSPPEPAVPQETVGPVNKEESASTAPEKSAPEAEKPPKPARKKAVVKKKAAAVGDLNNFDVEEKGAGNSPFWYVIHTLSGQENKVKENLESRLQSEEMVNLVTQVLIPTENVSEVKSGKKTVTTRKFFPGYVLVNMILNEKTWYFIRNTSGVIGFIGTGKPVPLQDHEVSQILSQIEEKKEKVKPKVMFDVGENVKVNDGPFINFTGTVDEVNPDRGKLKVVVSIFGRATPIELEYWQVERS